MEKVAPLHSPFYKCPLNNNHKPKQRTRSLSVASSSTIPSLEPNPLSVTSTTTSSFPTLDGFGEARSLCTVKAMHAQMTKICNKWNSNSIAKTLITSYLELGQFRYAVIVFFVVPYRNYLMLNDFMEEFERFKGNPILVLDVFRELNCKGVVFESSDIAMILKICGRVMESWLGLEVQANLIKRGFEMDEYVRSALMNFYGVCWGVESVNRVFRSLHQDEVLWNENIIVNLKNQRYAEALELFKEMQFSFVKANPSTVVKILQACGKIGAFGEGKQIHGCVLRYGLDSNLLISNALISMYSKNKRLEFASKVFYSMKDRSLSSWNSIISSYAAAGCLSDVWDIFHSMKSSGTEPDIVTWNCLLSGHALHCSYKEVLKILQRMQDDGFRPNSSSVSSVLQAVIEIGNLSLGKEIHGYVIRNGLDYDVYVETSLIDMYVKNDCLSNAQEIFDRMKNRNIFAWNSLIAGYSFKGRFEDAKRLLNGMQEEGIKPDLVTWNGLVFGYALWGHSEEALSIIHEIKSSGLTPNVVSWTALVSGCSQKEKYREAFEFFIQMQREGIKPNTVTISSLLRAFGGLSMLQKGKEVHCFCTKNGFIDEAYINTALIDMYSKSGDIKSAYKIFRKIKKKTLALWNCMMMGLAIHSRGSEVISLFNEMQKAGTQPDAITFTALLSGCKNSGLVDEGWKYFDSMTKDYSINPTIEHYSCMVDLLGRAGYLDEAWDFIQTMPLKPDATVWGAFLGSCRIHGDIEFAEIAARNLFVLEPNNSANYILMMNLYAASNRWEDVEHIKDVMLTKGVKTGQAWSWIQIDEAVHVFAAGGKPHQHEGEIYFEIYQLVSEMKDLGYVPDINCIYQNVNDEEKEKLLISHTEKLAITYGLMNRRSNAPIRVIKNTRICSDCHTAAKYMSSVRDAEIFVRDGVRFHHFKEGKCSCSDHW